MQSRFDASIIMEHIKSERNEKTDDHIGFDLKPDLVKNHVQQQFIFSLQKLKCDEDDDEDEIESDFEVNITNIIKRLEDEGDIKTNDFYDLDSIFDQVKSEGIENSDKNEILKDEKPINFQPNEFSTQETKIKTNSRRKLSKVKCKLWDDFEVENNSTWFLPYVKECEVKVERLAYLVTRMYDSISVDSKRKIVVDEIDSARNRKKMKSSELESYLENAQINKKKTPECKNKSKSKSISSLKSDKKLANESIKCLKLEQHEIEKIDKISKRRYKSKNKISTKATDQSSDDELIFTNFTVGKKFSLTDDNFEDNHNLIKNKYIVISKTSSRKIKPILIHQRKSKSRNSKKVTFCSSIFIRRFVPEDVDYEDDS